MTSIPADKVSRPHPVIGVIGGMGPEATVDLMRRVIAKTPAEDDADHVHLIVESNPKIPSRIAHLLDGTGPDPTPELVRIAGNLERAGAHALAMPCNTAHIYAGEIRRAVRIPFIDMIEATVDRATALAPGARIALLASDAVHRVGIYAATMEKRGLHITIPPRQDAVMDTIRAVKRGDTTGARTRLGEIVKGLTAQCDLIVVACTELSAIADGIDARMLDAADVLADKILEFAGVDPRRLP